MRIRAMLTASLVVFALAMAGCGGDDDAADDTKSSDNTSESEPTDEETEDEGDGGSELDVCALLTPADLQAAFGSPFDSGELTHQEQTGGDQCAWVNTDPPPAKTFSITVLRDDSLSDAFKEGGVTVAKLHQDTKALSTNVEELDLGDDAYLSNTTVAVLDGDTLYTFGTLFGDSPEAIAGLKSLAEKVVG